MESAFDDAEILNASGQRVILEFNPLSNDDYDSFTGLPGWQGFEKEAYEKGVDVTELADQDASGHRAYVVTFRQALSPTMLAIELFNAALQKINVNNDSLKVFSKVVLNTTQTSIVLDAEEQQELLIWAREEFDHSFTMDNGVPLVIDPIVVRVQRETGLAQVEVVTDEWMHTMSITVSPTQKAVEAYRAILSHELGQNLSDDSRQKLETIISAVSEQDTSLSAKRMLELVPQVELEEAEEVQEEYKLLTEENRNYLRDGTIDIFVVHGTVRNLLLGLRTQPRFRELGALFALVENDPIIWPLVSNVRMKLSGRNATFGAGVELQPLVRRLTNLEKELVTFAAEAGLSKGSGESLSAKRVMIDGEVLRKRMLTGTMAIFANLNELDGLLHFLEGADISPNNRRSVEFFNLAITGQQTTRKVSEAIREYARVFSETFTNMTKAEGEDYKRLTKALEDALEVTQKAMERLPVADEAEVIGMSMTVRKIKDNEAVSVVLYNKLKVLMENAKKISEIIESGNDTSLFDTVLSGWGLSATEDADEASDAFRQALIKFLQSEDRQAFQAKYVEYEAALKKELRIVSLMMILEAYIVKDELSSEHRNRLYGYSIRNGDVLRETMYKFTAGDVTIEYLYGQLAKYDSNGYNYKDRDATLAGYYRYSGYGADANTRNEQLQRMVDQVMGEVKSEEVDINSMTAKRDEETKYDPNNVYNAGRQIRKPVMGIDLTYDVESLDDARKFVEEFVVEFRERQFDPRTHEMFFLTTAEQAWNVKEAVAAAEQEGSLPFDYIKIAVTGINLDESELNDKLMTISDMKRAEVQAVYIHGPGNAEPGKVAPAQIKQVNQSIREVIDAGLQPILYVGQIQNVRSIGLQRSYNAQYISGWLDGITEEELIQSNLTIMLIPDLVSSDRTQFFATAIREAVREKYGLNCSKQDSNYSQ